jgi:hypothetical protein
MSIHKYIVTETIRTEIRATSMEHAKRRWLESKDIWSLMAKGFLDVKERYIEPQEPDPPAQAEEF